MPGGRTRREALVSRGKKFVAVSLLTFIALVVVGAAWGHHGPADTTGTSTLTNSYTTVLGGAGKEPVSQVGLNHIANAAGHAAISVNFTWVLITGFLVLFMQVG